MKEQTKERIIDFLYWFFEEGEIKAKPWTILYWTVAVLMLAFFF